MSVYLSINLDVTRTGVQKTLSGVSVGENEKDLLISLSKGDEVYKPPVGSMAILYVEKPDGTHGMFKCDVSNGCVISPVRPQMTSVAGNVRCQVEIVTALQSVLYCPEFILEVAATVQNNTELVIESDDDYQDIDAILEAANAFWEKGGVRVVDELPEEAVENTIAYLLGDGLYRYADDEWIQLTDDGTIATVTVLSAVSHTHANKTVLDAITAEKVAGWDTAAENEHTHSNADVLDTITAAMVNNSHGHSNKSVLDKLSVSGIGLYYDGRMVGIPAITNGLPSNFPDGTIIFHYGNGPSSGFWLCRQYENRTAWTQLFRLSLVTEVEALRQDSHTHTNKALLDLITEAMVNNIHSHSNKATLDTITSEKVTAWDEAVTDKHTHSNKSVLDTVTSDVVNNSHSHTNKTVLDKFSESSGTLLYDGDEIGSGITVVDTPAELPESASDGSTALACFDGHEEHLIYPSQSSSEEVTVNVAGKEVKVFHPTFNEDAIDDAITAQDISASATLYIETSDTHGDIVFSLLPVVDDIETNEYTSAGITLDDAIVTSTYTKKYAVSAFIDTNIVRPDKIIDVDLSTEKIPFLGVYTFETVTNDDNETLSTGWNMYYATVDKATHEVISAVELVGNVDINDYIILSDDPDNTLTLEGTCASILLNRVVDVVQKSKEKGLYVRSGTWSLADDAQDYTPLSFKQYTNLYVRDLVKNDSIQDVPVYLAGDVGVICKLLDANDNSISLEEARNTAGDDIGKPVRFIKVFLNNTAYVWCPEPIYGLSTTPSGWSTGGQSTTAPSISGFTPVKMEVGNTTYTDLSIIPEEAKLALGSLSQCFNESADDMGHINIPDDAVIRYAGKIEANRKYYFKTSYDFSISLPDVRASKTDAQFVMYLDCGYDGVDVSLPEDALISGEIDTSQGNHKIIGCWLEDKKTWAVGGLTYEEASS